MNVDTSQTIVLDNGSGIIKAGLASDRIPKCIIQNRVLRSRNGDSHSDILIDDDSDLAKISVNRPMQHGCVVDWDDMERIWHHIYTKKLRLLSDEHPVLFAEPVLNPNNNCEKLMEIFFEKFNIPAASISMQAILALYSTGRSTGVVLDCGEGITTAVPIYRGFALPESIKRVNFSGREVDEYLRMLLKKEGANFQTSANFEIVRQLKEESCYMSEDPIIEENKVKNVINYKLPDGNEIEVGPSRYRAAEVLFNPYFLGRECDGIHKMLSRSIEDSDLDLRSTLYKNIVLSGGSTLFKGFGSRLLTELKKICPKHAALRIAAPMERLYSVWIGGSVLASLSLFKDSVTTKQSYEECGKELFRKKRSNIMLDHYYYALNKHGSR